MATRASQKWEEEITKLKAEDASLKETQDQIKNMQSELHHDQQKLANQQQDIAEMQYQMRTDLNEQGSKLLKLDEILQRLAAIDKKVHAQLLPNPNQHAQLPPNPNQGSTGMTNAGCSGQGSGYQNPFVMGHQMGGMPRLPKLDFPKFNGEDPTSWLYKAEQYFAVHQIAMDQRVPIASFHLENEAVQWYQYVEKSQGILTWKEFQERILTRFGPTAFEDFTGELTKLTQRRTVREYQTEFERLANRTSGLTDDFFMRCFISGLKEEIRAEVKMFKPTNMTEALGLAKLAEDKLDASRKAVRPPFRSNFQPRLQTTSNFQPRPPNTSNGRPWKIKRLSPEEMRQRREKGLCYNCDEKFITGHICKEQQLYVLDASRSDDSDIEECQELQEEENQTEEEGPQEEPCPEISVHALAGLSAPQTMKVHGHFKGQSLVVLIDSGSTHNFIDPRVARQANCFVYPSNSFEVMIANGGKLACKGKCRNVKLSLGEYKLQSDMYVLALGGCDVVLGAQWLRTLGPILWDFSELWMQFTSAGQQYMLKGLQAGPSQIISSHRMEKLLKKGSRGMMAQLCSMQMAGQEDSVMPQDLQMVLSSYDQVFREPTGLPPPAPP